jgi:predicted nucleotidyltransferase component of viral defense system
MRVREPHTIPGDFQVETPMEYSRGGSRTRGLPLVKIHLTFDEPIMTKQAVRRVRPRYSDLSEFQISSYSKKEIAAEKMRALLQQQKKWPRPRDLYDLWFMLCQTRERLEADEMRGLFAGKCKVRGIQPDIAALISESIYEWNESAWEDLLRPTMKTVPDFKKVWREWLTAFHELFG